MTQKNFSNFEQGDIIVADIIFSEQVGVKRRPALVISNSQFNRASEDIIVLKITSANKKTDFDIPLTNKDLVEGELNLDSVIMVDFPVTVYKGSISQHASRISKQKLAEVKTKIRELYSL